METLLQKEKNHGANAERSSTSKLSDLKATTLTADLSLFGPQDFLISNVYHQGSGAQLQFSTKSDSPGIWCRRVQTVPEIHWLQVLVNFEII